MSRKSPTLADIELGENDDSFGEVFRDMQRNEQAIFTMNSDLAGLSSLADLDDDSDYNCNLDGDNRILHASNRCQRQLYSSEQLDSYPDWDMSQVSTRSDEQSQNAYYNDSINAALEDLNSYIAKEATTADANSMDLLSATPDGYADSLYYDLNQATNSMSSLACSPHISYKTEPNSMDPSYLSVLSISGDAAEGASYTEPELLSPSSDTESKSGLGSPKGEARFWNYNSQAKGPKPERFNLNVTPTVDPHREFRFVDPVFDDAQEINVRHFGKARKGDGNDVTANPSKLHAIGQQLDELNTEIEKLSKSSDPADKKEKNRLSSKVCRLKKKANNEANKIKLHLLRKEHEELNQLIGKIKSEITSPNTTQPLTPKVKSLISSLHKTRAAGQTADLVDEVLEKVSKGEKTGGI